MATDVGERQRFEERLRETDAKYRALTEHLPAITYVHPVGERGAPIYVSPQVASILGYSAQEWIAQPELFYRLLHPEDRERVRAEIAAAAEGTRALRCEYRMLSRDGRTVWVHDEAVTVRDDDGRPFYTQGYLLDVSERRDAAEERERLLAAERAAAAEAVDRQRKLDVLARSGEILGSSRDYQATLRRVADLAVRDLADWCLVDLIDEEGAATRIAAGQAGPGKPGPEPSPLPEPDVLEVIRRGRPELSESRMCVPLRARGRALGALTLLTQAPGRSYGADDLAAAQELAGMAALAVDNAHLTREVEEAADAARVLTYVADGVTLVDRTGTIRLWNPAAEAITGLPSDAVLGHTAAEAISGWKTLAQRIPVGPASEPVMPETLPLETERGERWISISGVDFFGGTVYAFRDLTDAHRLEELKADFVATASHELRTPLAAVYGAAQTLRRHDFALDEAGRDRFVSLIVDESERLNRIVNEILLANQLDAGRLDLVDEPFDPGDLVERVVESAREHGPPGITLETVLGDSLPSVAADRDRVRQVLVNLVENAIKYSPDGGRIEVGVESVGGLDQLPRPRRGPRHPRRRAGPDLREVLPPRPRDDARDRGHGARPLHLQRARRAHGRPHLGRVARGRRLDVLVRAPRGRGDRRPAGGDRAARDPGPLEPQLELELVPQRDAVGPDLADLRLQPSPGVVHGARAKVGEGEPAPLGEAQHLQVVVRRHEPDPLAVGNLVPERLDERRPDAPARLERDDRDQLAVVSLAAVGEETDELAVLLGHEARERRRVDELATPGLERAAELLLENSRRAQARSASRYGRIIPPPRTGATRRGRP